MKPATDLIEKTLKTLKEAEAVYIEFIISTYQFEHMKHEIPQWLRLKLADPNKNQ